ncbi:unnamed protein product [Phyllotreta striolata]|uniref:Uncharacterized protein n=1 Tax=Phyllotreta striolata TaxID=444603 RepID=A0A9P0DTJ2_PHYSR|nr:unnamed protein product [Phyllotreta striolata]
MVDISGNINISREQYNEVCRTCITNSGLVDLFENKHNELVFSELFKMFSLLDLDPTDNMPKKICSTCAEIVVQFYLFKERIHQSQIILKDTLHSIKIKAEVKEENEILIDQVDNDSVLDYPAENNTDSDIDAIAEEKNITCSFCNSKFSSYSSYTKHRKKEAELRRKREPCIICNKVISTYKLKDHLNSHTKEAPYECNECGEKYRFRSSLSRHKFIHQEKKPHMCHLCGKGFIQAPTLTDHIRTHYKEKSFICNICGKTFITKHSLTNHIYTHKKDDTNTNDLCNLLSNSDASQNTGNRLTSHREKTHLCSKCGKKFSTKSLLNQHQKLHSDIKPHQCNVCNKSFSLKNSLIKHHHIHGGEKLHACVVCNKRFSQKGHLTYHMRTHSGEKPYSCTYCQKAFSHSGSYKVHIRIHTGDRPYTCDLCKKGFYDSSSMKKHRKIHDKSIE